MQSDITASYLPGNQVDGLPGVVNTKAIQAAQGKKWPATIDNFRSKFDQFENVSVDYMLVNP